MWGLTAVNLEVPGRVTKHQPSPPIETQNLSPKIKIADTKQPRNPLHPQWTTLTAYEKEKVRHG
jgi:hypothetical protein